MMPRADIPRGRAVLSISPRPPAFPEVTRSQDIVALHREEPLHKAGVELEDFELKPATISIMDCFDEDEFADDIDWSSIPMPTPTPRKRQRLANDSQQMSGLLSHLEMAQEYAPSAADCNDGREVGDELQNRAISLAVEQGRNLFLTGETPHRGCTV